jgi:hypothetical protein
MSRGWYFVALLPLVIGAGIAVLAFTRLIDSIEQMPRMVVPGEKTFTLPAGEYVIYAESQSTVDGVAYVNERFRVNCSLSASDSSPLPLSSHGGKLKYDLGDYEGGAIFDFELPADGTAKLACETDQPKAVLAIGKSFAMTIVAGVVPLVFGLLGALLAFFVIRRRRKRYLALVSARDNT